MHQSEQVASKHASKTVTVEQLIDKIVDCIRDVATKLSCDVDSLPADENEVKLALIPRGSADAIDVSACVASAVNVLLHKSLPPQLIDMPLTESFFTFEVKDKLRIDINFKREIVLRLKENIESRSDLNPDLKDCMIAVLAAYAKKFLLKT